VASRASSTRRAAGRLKTAPGRPRAGGLVSRPAGRADGGPTSSGRLPGFMRYVSRGDSPFPMDNGGFLDTAALAIFPEYLAFDGEEVLQLAVPGASGRTANLHSST
jgi:hypothetical protein